MDAITRRRAIFVILSLTVLSVSVVFLLKPIPQDLSYHHFCDSRLFFGVPYFANVVSNFPFIIVGIWGFVVLGRSEAPYGIKIIYSLLFTGILCTAFGSAWYHLQPGNDSLVFDRLPMTIVFMALLAAVIEEGFGPPAGLILLIPLLTIGMGSIWWWHHTELQGAGDLRLYILVQYYSMLVIPALLSLSPSGRRKLKVLLWALAWYLVAKLFDQLDCAVYTTSGFISGHTIKHLAAAVSTVYLVKMYNERADKE